MSLSRDTVEAQVSQIELLQAMYPGDDELIIDDSTRESLDLLKAWCFDNGPEPQTIPRVLTLTVHLAANERKSLQVIIDIMLYASNEDDLVSDTPKIRIRQPDWLTRGEVASLTAGVPHEDLFAALDHLQNEIETRSVSPTLSAADPHSTDTPSELVERIVRVWFLFPSLSTRAKRDDLVNHAPTYTLTGFVLAGKPGILCLEGQSSNIDAYMKFIKTESWGDIPSHHKKVSERYREDGDGKGVKRVFEGMQEITDTLGERRGERANRGDMRALEGWLGERGLGAVFERVLL